MKVGENISEQHAHKIRISDAKSTITYTQIFHTRTWKIRIYRQKHIHHERTKRALIFYNMSKTDCIQLLNYDRYTIRIYNQRGLMA